MVNSNEFYDVVEVPQDWNFQLLGHGVRQDFYPDWVIPVGKLNGENASIYIKGAGKVNASYLHDQRQTVMHDASTTDSLSGFDFQQHYLFAIAANELTFHSEEQRPDFVRDFLSGERFKDLEAIQRLSLAHASKDVDLIIAQMRPAALVLSSNPEFIHNWYAHEIISARTPEEKLGLELPELADRLEDPTTRDLILNGI